MGEMGRLHWFVRGGSKTQKLEFRMANAVARKATVVITLGSTQSDLARQSAAIASKLAMERHLSVQNPPGIRNLKDWPKGDGVLAQFHGAVGRRCPGGADGAREYGGLPMNFAPMANIPTSLLAAGRTKSGHPIASTPLWGSRGRRPPWGCLSILSCMRPVAPEPRPS